MASQTLCLASVLLLAACGAPRAAPTSSRVAAIAVPPAAAPVESVEPAPDAAAPAHDDRAESPEPDACAATTTRRDGCRDETFVGEFVGAEDDADPSGYSHQERWYHFRVVATWSYLRFDVAQAAVWIPQRGDDPTRIPPVPRLTRGRRYLVHVAMGGMGGCLPFLSSATLLAPQKDVERDPRVVELGPTCPLPSESP